MIVPCWIPAPAFEIRKTSVTNPPLISIVVPFFDEQDNIPEFFRRLTPILQELNSAFEIICVNDGSSDTCRW